MSKALVLIILPLVLGCAHALAQDTVQIVSTAAQQVRTNPAPVADAQQITDEQICRMSIAAYKDNYNRPCPCPYSTKANGSKCGGNSAYSKAGGNPGPICFPEDCTPEMITRIRASL